MSLDKGFPASLDDAVRGDYESINTESVVDAASGNSYEVDQLAKSVYDEEDDNSPFSASGSQSHTFSLASEYDRWLFQFDLTNADSTVQRFGMRVNGDSGTNYSRQGEGGGTASAESDYGLTKNVSGGGDYVGTWILAGRWGGSHWISAPIGAAGTASDTGPLRTGVNGNVTSPLTQFTVRGSSGPIDVNVIRAYGVDL